MNRLHRLIALIGVSLLLPRMTTAQVLVDLESGVVFPGAYNDIQIPREGATRFNAFGPGFDKTPGVFLRGRLGYTINDRHTIVALAAPLTVETVTRQGLDSPITFEGVTFTAGRPLQVRYQFNSYRLTYRYNFVRTEQLRLAAGVTAKLRDARIRLDNGVQERSQTNLGFVPLLNVYANWTPGGRVGLLVEGDGTYAPNFGRAYDFFGGLTYAVAPKTRLKAGYRLFEGGSFVESTYNLLIAHYASVGVIVGL